MEVWEAPSGGAGLFLPVVLPGRSEALDGVRGGKGGKGRGEGDAAKGGPLRPAFAEIRARMEAAGFRPRKRLGQNFLLDPSLHEAIVEAAGVEPGDRVLEIGSGAGFLTAHLLQAGASVLAVEVDSRLAEISRGVLSRRGELTLLVGDVLEGKNRLNPKVVEAARAHAGDRGLKVVANLPYSVSGPVLALLALSSLPFQVLVFLVQKELAQKALARPGGPHWGHLGFVVGLRFQGKLLRTVPPQVFRPRPKVVSALVRLWPRKRPLIQPGPRIEALALLARKLFSRRRKSLRGALKSLGVSDPDMVLEKAGVSGDVRVGEVEAETMDRLLSAWPGGETGLFQG